ncbi:MAG: NAD(P)/FAD-dependent oxidoreductase [Deltaproteobacteria bacterium]|nr:NAD(P)/FAD-dependent oxidoreductase [Deltaproteobacteria bacterium]
MQTDADLIVVGAGPAGLEAALIAARARLRVRVIDAPASRRNASASWVHGTIGLDHLSPDALRARGQESLARCGVVVESGCVANVGQDEHGLVVVLRDHASSSLRARRVLLATGLHDVLPELAGLAETWGATSFSCPYCHGLEISREGEARWGVLAHEVAALKMAPLYTRWARRVVLFTDGRQPPSELRAAHEAAGLVYETGRVRALRHEGSALRAVVLEDDREIAIDALVHRPTRTLGPLVETLGLMRDEHGLVVVNGRGETSRKGLHACGDLTTTPHQIVFAMADGAHAAMAIVSAIAFEDVLLHRA